MKTARAIGFYSALAFCFVAALLPQWNQAIVGGLQDTRLFLWNTWWFHHAIDVLHVNPFRTMMLFYPFGARLVSHDFPLWMNLVTWGGQHLGFSLAGACNLWFVLTWVLTGICVWGLAREVLRSMEVESEWPAYAAGLYAMTHSYTLARAMQNWGQFNMYAIALFLWSLLRARRVQTRGAFLLSGIALAWAVTAHYYFFIYCGLIWALVAARDIGVLNLTVTKRVPPRVLAQTLLSLAVSGGVVALFILMRPGNIVIGKWTIGLHGPENALFVLWMGVAIWGLLHIDLHWEGMTIRRDAARNHLTLFLSAFLLLSPLWWESLRLALEGGYPKQSVLWKTHLPGANLLALFAPNGQQALWGPVVSGWFTSRGMNPQEQAAAIGWVCLIVVLWRWSSRRKPGSIMLDPVPPSLTLTEWDCPPFGDGLQSAGVTSEVKWLLLAGGSTLLAMGAHLHIAQYNTWMPLPFFFVRLLPVVGNVRVPERWMALGAIAWAVVLSLALARLAKSRGWSLKAVGLCACALILVENWPGLPLVRPSGSLPVYETLRQLPEGAVLALPFYAGDSSIGTGNALEGTRIFPWDHLWAQTFHEKPMIGGYIGRISRRVIDRYHDDPFMKSVIELEERQIPHKEPEPMFGEYALANLGIRYVLVYPDQTEPSALAYVIGSLPLQKVAESAGVVLYRIRQ